MFEVRTPLLDRLPLSLSRGFRNVYLDSPALGIFPGSQLPDFDLICRSRSNDSCDRLPLMPFLPGLHGDHCHDNQQQSAPRQ